MAAFDNINSLQKKFINNGFPYFAIYENNLKSYSNIHVDDVEEASDMLKDELLDFEKSPTAYDSKIAIYTSDNKLFIQKSTLKDLKEKCSAALTVRFLDQMQANNNNNSGSANLQVLQILQEMRNDMNIQREKIASLEAEMQDDDDEDDDDGNPIIGALKSNPELMNTIVTGAMAALGNIFKKPVPITSLGSVEVDDDKILKSIEILKLNDDKLADHLEILANMSIDNPGQFKWLLSMLK